jgi:hypothetical protein
MQFLRISTAAFQEKYWCTHCNAFIARSTYYVHYRKSEIITYADVQLAKAALDNLNGFTFGIKKLIITLERICI